VGHSALLRTFDMSRDVLYRQTGLASNAMGAFRGGKFEILKTSMMKQLEFLGRDRVAQDEAAMLFYCFDS